MAKQPSKNAISKTAVQQKKSGTQPKSAAARPNSRSAQKKTSTKPKLPGGKIGSMIELLSKPDGATLDDLVHATSWQRHSVRGALSGTIKKKLGIDLRSEKTASGRVYRIAR